VIMRGVAGQLDRPEPQLRARTLAR
jgi:hypothetical protein